MNEREIRDLLRAVETDDGAVDAPHLDERWDKLAAGLLTPAEEAELRAEAQGSEELLAALNAFAPLGDDFEDRVMGRLDAILPESTRAPAPSLLERWRAWWSSGPWTMALPVAALAVILIAVVPQLGGPEPLPPYSMDALQGVSTVRSATPAEGVAQYLPTSTLEVKVRPDTAASGPVQALAFVDDGSGFAPLPLQAEPFESGTVRLHGVVGEIGLDTGRHTLAVAVGNAGRPLDAADVSKAIRSPELVPRWQVLTTRFEVIAP